MNTRETAGQMQTIPQETATWVQNVLEPDQLTTVKSVQRFGRRMLRPGTMVVLWVLRLYVVVMFFLITYQIWIALHP